MRPETDVSNDARCAHATRFGAVCVDEFGSDGSDCPGASSSPDQPSGRGEVRRVHRRRTHRTAVRDDRLPHGTVHLDHLVALRTVELTFHHFRVPIGFSCTRPTHQHISFSLGGVQAAVPNSVGPSIVSVSPVPRTVVCRDVSRSRSTLPAGRRMDPGNRGLPTHRGRRRVRRGRIHEPSRSTVFAVGIVWALDPVDGDREPAAPITSPPLPPITPPPLPPITSPPPLTRLRVWRRSLTVGTDTAI